MQKRYHYLSPTYVSLKKYFTKSLPSSNFCYRILGKEHHFRVNYIYIGHFSGKLYSIVDQKSLISLPYPDLIYLKTRPFTVAHTHIA